MPKKIYNLSAGMNVDLETPGNSGSGIDTDYIVTHTKFERDLWGDEYEVALFSPRDEVNANLRPEDRFTLCAYRYTGIRAWTWGTQEDGNLKNRVNILTRP